MNVNEKEIERHLPEWAVLVKQLCEEARKEHEAVVEKKIREVFLRNR